eukprot:TRINITY_DN4898_c3_g1_i1.p1 TRINITY_DN4898_c3_g1~~TRINITY_DN4898_c3_g1_i1.p1  ORF type:complete len:1151 (+),score=163.53 TRINITY_DN4898_c3_g1_i1:54-3455(+)
MHRQMLILLLLCANTISGQCISSNITFNSTHTYQCMVSVRDGYALHWNYVEGDSEADIALTHADDGYISIAFPDKIGDMYPAVSVIGDLRGILVYFFDSSDFESRNGFTIEKNIAAGEKIGLLYDNSTVGRESGFTILRFTRDTKRFNKGPININMYSEDGRAKFRKHRSIPLTMSLDFLTSTVTYGNSKLFQRRIHGSLMVAGWCYLLPFGILIKRYGKPIFGLGNSIHSRTGFGMAFYLHVFVMTATLITVITGFVYKVNSTAKGIEEHRYVGYTVFSIILAMPFFGSLSVLFPDPDTAVRKVARYVHPMLGRAVGVLAFFQVFRGIERMEMTDTLGAGRMKTASIIGLSVFTGIAIVLEVIKRKFHVRRRARLARTINVTKVPWAEIKEHNNAIDPWVVIEGRVFAVKSWLTTHPGGAGVLLEFAGDDATETFIDNAHSLDARRKLESFYIGEVEDERMVSAISLADDIASAIVKLNLDDAKVLINESVEDVPRTLLSAYTGLVDNLASYLPFLPGQLIEQAQVSNSSQYTMSPKYVTEPTQDPFAAQMEANPASYAAIVFTDIQASTLLWEACPGSMRSALNTHNEVIRSVIQKCEGYEVKTIGDAFMVAFRTSKDALRFSLTVQQKLVQADWPSGLLKTAYCKEKKSDSGSLLWRGPRVRIGIHAGDVEPQKNPLTGRIDFFGKTVNKAARVESVAVGGSVAVTEEVLQDIGDDVKELGEMELSSLGKVPLRGVVQLSNISIVLPGDLLQRRSEVLTAAHKKKTSSTLPFSKSPPESSLSTALKHHKMPLRSVASTVATIKVNYRYLKQMGSAPEGLGALMTPIFETVQKTEGIFQSVCGSVMLVTWNVMKRCPQHVVQATRFAAIFRGTGRNFISYSDVWGDMVNVGITTGASLHGRVGTETQKNMMVIGGAVDMSLMLASKASVLGTFALCSAIPGVPGIAEEPSVEDYIRPIELFTCAPHPPSFSQQLFVYELNLVGLAACISSWGFSSEGPADATWGSVFKLSVKDALRGSKPAYEVVSQTIEAARVERTCSVCKTRCSVFTCAECEHAVCGACFEDTCRTHNSKETLNGPESSLHFIKSACLAAAVDSVPPMPYDITLNLSDTQNEGWLGTMGEEFTLGFSMR